MQGRGKVEQPFGHAFGGRGHRRLAAEVGLFLEGREVGEGVVGGVADEGAVKGAGLIAMTAALEKTTDDLGHAQGGGAGLHHHVVPARRGFAVAADIGDHRPVQRVQGSQPLGGGQRRQQGFDFAIRPVERLGQPAAEQGRGVAGDAVGGERGQTRGRLGEAAVGDIVGEQQQQGDRRAGVRRRQGFGQRQCPLDVAVAEVEQEGAANEAGVAGIVGEGIGDEVGGAPPILGMLGEAAGEIAARPEFARPEFGGW